MGGWVVNAEVGGVPMKRWMRGQASKDGSDSLGEQTAQQQAS